MLVRASELGVLSCLCGGSLWQVRVDSMGICGTILFVRVCIQPAVRTVLGSLQGSPGGQRVRGVRALQDSLFREGRSVLVLFTDDFQCLESTC